MPYSKTVLAQTGNALSLEMKGLVDAALTASGKFTRVTTGYVNTTRTFDVWLNDGTTDGYPWYLVVATDTAMTGRVLLSGMLEYDDATKIAKKALRGTGSLGWVNAAGYPTVSAGGAEMTFTLSGFTTSPTLSFGNLGGTGSTPATAAAGNTMRVLVTGQVVWVWWGTATVGAYCLGVGTYTRLGNTTQDLMPLGFLAHNTQSGGGTVWQSPSTTGSQAIRSTASNVLASNTSSLGAEVYSALIGQLGVGPDLNYDTGAYVGSRLHVIRDAGGNPNTSGGGSYLATAGFSLGLAPADFLLFGKNATAAVGDTVQVGSSTFELVTNAGNGTGLCVNTTPAV